MWLEFYEKRKLKRIVFSYPFLGILGVIALLLTVPMFSAYCKAQNAKDSRMAVATQLHELRLRDVALQEEIDRLSTDRGIEEELRSKYEVGKEGEQMIVIVGEPTRPIEHNSDTNRKGFFGRIASWL